jgi:hypothetical protein
MIITEQRLNQLEQFGYMSMMVGGWCDGVFQITNILNKAEGLLGKPITAEILNFCQKVLISDTINLCMQYEKELDEILVEKRVVDEKEIDEILNKNEGLIINVIRIIFSYYNYKHNVNRKKYSSDENDDDEDIWGDNTYINYDSDSYIHIILPENREIIKSQMREYIAFAQEWLDISVE